MCPECEGYRHGKRNPMLNGGWCPRCCHSDGTPKPFTLTEDERREEAGGTMIDWHATAHHFGWYTFDHCDRDGCDDPTHTAPEQGPERDAAMEQSKERESAKAARRHAEQAGG